METVNITIKTEEQLELMRESGKRLSMILSELVKMALPGIRTGDLDSYAEDRCEQLDCTPAFKGYFGFPKSVCISVNEQVVHGIPADGKVLNEGDIVSLDFGVIYKGWYSDSARTVGVGQISEKAAALIKATKESLDKGIEQCFEGNQLSNIGHHIQKHAESLGFSIVKEYIGHGIGQRLHEEPGIRNFGPKDEGPVLKSGMVLAIEPLLNAGSDTVSTLKDGWTVVTSDGELSAHFEHTVAITPNGPEILTKYEE